MDYEQLGHILESIHPGVTIADSSECSDLFQTPISAAEA